MSASPPGPGAPGPADAPPSGRDGPGDDVRHPAEESPEEAEERFRRAWRQPSGPISYFSSVNQGRVGRWFLAAGFVFFLAGGLLALLMRTQLAVPEGTFLTPEQYNAFFTMHGTTMLFLFAVPILEGFATFLIPPMIGSRDLPYPRLTAFGFWCYLFGGLLVYAGFFFGLQSVPDGAWFMYPPLTDAEFSPARGADFWLLGVTLTEVAGVVAAIDLIAAILKLRAPGMSMNRIPIFAWAMLVVAFMIVFAFTPLILADGMLELQRTLDLPFFDPSRGGSPMLWQHLFWIFGHPEVYIIFLPAAGFVSMVVPTFARRPIAGYTWVVAALVAIGFASFGVWAHHMFTTGLPQLSMNFFSAGSMLVSVPAGILVFSWLATVWNGRPRLTTSMLFALGFLALFVMGGLTGVTVAVIPFDWQVHDTYYLVAHFHFVLVGGMVFPLFAAFYYWWPSLAGRRLDETLGRWHFWLFLVGFLLAFFTMHVTGFRGMPRQVYTYPAGLDWGTLNAVSTVGAYVLAAGVVVFAANVVRSLTGEPDAGDDPWGAGELEALAGSPAPAYNFRSIPRITSRRPALEQQGLRERIRAGEELLAVPYGETRETLGTSVVHAEPEQVIRLSEDSFAPIATAASLTLAFVGVIAESYLLAAVGAALLVATVLAWHWTPPPEVPEAVERRHLGELPMDPPDGRSIARWGMRLGLLASGVTFAYLLVSYVYVRGGESAWPPPRVATPEVWVPLGVVVLAGVGGWLLRTAATRTRRGRDGAGVLAGVAAAAGMLGAAAGAGWLLLQDVSAGDTAYGAFFHAIQGFFLVHVAAAALASGLVGVRALRGLLSPLRPVAAANSALLWGYTSVVGLAAILAVNGLPLLW